LNAAGKITAMECDKLQKGKEDSRIALLIVHHYNTFMSENVKMNEKPETRISSMLTQIQQPARMQILLIIGESETCVCHIEAIIGMRQATISQHLMGLRKAGLVSTRRDGRHIYYRLTKPEIIKLLHHAARVVEISPDALDHFSLKPFPGCTCPQCNPDPDRKSVC